MFFRLRIKMWENLQLWAELKKIMGGGGGLALK